MAWGVLLTFKARLEQIENRLTELNWEDTADAKEITAEQLLDHFSSDHHYFTGLLHSSSEFDATIAPVTPPQVESTEQKALKAVLDGGLPGLLTAVSKIKAVDKAEATMNKMLDSDNAATYYAWRVKDWEEHLGQSRKTIMATSAYRVRIKNWQAENAERVSKKTICRKTGD